MASEAIREPDSEPVERFDAWSDLPVALLERQLLKERTDESSEAAERAVTEAVAGFPDACRAPGPFQTIVDTAGLDEVAARVLALCAAVETDRRLQRVVGTLVGSPAATRVDVQLVADLLGPEAVSALAPGAVLRRAALLELDAGTPLASASILVPPVVTWALLGEVALDPELPPGTEYVFAEDEEVGVAEVVLVHGTDPVRRRQAGAGAAYGLAFVAARLPEDRAGWDRLVRQATVVGAGLVIEAPAELPAVVRDWVESASHLAIALCSEQPLDLARAPRRPYVEVTAGHPDVTPAEWEAAFPGSPYPARRPTATQLQAAATLRASGADGQEVMRRVATGTLLSHATRVVPRVGWDDLVLPPAQERQLRALVDRYRQRTTVHDEWGLDLFPSPGVVALFSGPSGTGKTTSAEAIAHELGVDMFRVDLSALVSKYIGETEKNLEEIFSAAHAGNYLLLFDEADSLFGSRSKVEESKDRYANLEVSYLLQRLETYDGLVVLTSNFQGNIDQAFLRRLHLTVHFTVPTADERRRIWQRSLGAAPVVDLDLGFVAQQFDITGGSIRNAALTAAFAAAAKTEPITMVDVLQAVSQELTKLGRRAHEAQFGPWLDQVAPGRP
jgi:AAA+ superfamily predicted ATPase